MAVQDGSGWQCDMTECPLPYRCLFPTLPIYVVVLGVWKVDCPFVVSRLSEPN